MVKEIKDKAKEANNKQVRLPQHRDLCTYLEQVASALYVFISRPQVDGLPKMGVLMEYLSDVLATDIRQYKIDLHQSKIKEQEIARSGPVGGLPLRGSPGDKGRGDRKRKQDEMLESLKQKPYQ